MSGVTSTPVRLKASEVMRRSRQVSEGEGKSRCQGWFIAPWNGVSKPISTISYFGPSVASHIATTQGWVTKIDKAAKILRMDFDIPSPRAAPDRAARPLDRLPEGGHHVLAHGLGRFAREGALETDHPVADKRLMVGR